jgi:hypothetical protein
MEIAYSVEGVPIRLTRERWFHIVENHNDLAGYYDDVLKTVEQPELILRGYNASLIAVRGYGRRGYLHVVYRQRYRNEQLVGIAVLDASTRSSLSSPL